MNKNEIEICEFEMYLKHFLFALWSYNWWHIFLPKVQVWKQVWILEIWPENGCGKWHILVWNRVRTWEPINSPPPRNSRSTPRAFSIKEMSSPDTYVSISFMRCISFWNHLIFLWRRHREKEKTLGNPAQYASNNSAQYWPILERTRVGLGQCCTVGMFCERKFDPISCATWNGH